MPTMVHNVLSNLAHRPATRRFPAVRRPAAPGCRGTVEFEMEKCIYCGACALRCPAGAIEVNRAESSLTFDVSRCIVCGCCAEACKKDGVHMRGEYASPVLRKPGAVRQTASSPASP